MHVEKNNEKPERTGMKPFNWGDISRFRSEMMGIAILLVILRHVHYPIHDMSHGLWRCGAVGTEMFLFFSGMGCWFSWIRRPQLRRFLTRRYIRIYPIWLVVASIVFTNLYLNDKGYARNIPELLCEILFNYSYWSKGNWTFWFVPAIMMIYMFTPGYITLIRRNPRWKWIPAAVLLWCFVVEHVPPIHDAVGHLYRFWIGTFTFLLGINSAELVQSKHSLGKFSLIWVPLLLVASFFVCYEAHQRGIHPTPWFLHRALYLPLMFALVMTLTKALSIMPGSFNRILRFIGGISLEIYLVHVELIYRSLHRVCHGYWNNVLAVTLISVALAWLLHKILSQITKHIPA